MRENRLRWLGHVLRRARDRGSKSDKGNEMV